MSELRKSMTVSLGRDKPLKWLNRRLPSEMGDGAEIIPSIANIADLFKHNSFTGKVRIELFAYERRIRRTFEDTEAILTFAHIRPASNLARVRNTSRFGAWTKMETPSVVELGGVGDDFVKDVR